MATHFEKSPSYKSPPVREIAAHNLWRGAIGALCVFWAVVAVCIWSLL